MLCDFAKLEFNPKGHINVLTYLLFPDKCCSIFKSGKGSEMLFWLFSYGKIHILFCQHLDSQSNIQKHV